MSRSTPRRRGGPRRTGRLGLAADLVRAAHPEPTVAVTTLAVLLGLAAGLSAPRAAVLGLAVLTGQLSIGWSNDLLDAARDRATGRGGKPVAAGRLPAPLLRAVTGGALAVCGPASLALGTGPGLLHLVAVGGGWAYNLGLKRTPASALPYAVSFGLLGAAVVLAAGLTPPGWLVGAGALLGVGAHLFNGLPDIADDRATGLRPLPVVLGPAGTRLGGCVLLGLAAALLALGPPGPPGPVAWLGLALAGGLALAAGASGGRSGDRRPFLLALAAATVDVGLLVAAAGTLVP